jgi:GAF domain-containing protein
VIDTTESEHRRLAALQRAGLLDTAPDAAYDDLTRIAARICDTPIGLMTLVDESRQWFKSRVGLDMTETPRNQAFCRFTILQDQPLVVEDTTRDHRFHDNPLVTGPPHIRFYAGAPLALAPDVRIGALCVLDREPRSLTASQLDALSVLRNAVVTRIELERIRQDTANELVTVCAWCRQVRPPAGNSATWLTPVDYLADRFPVSHGLCPQCFTRMDDAAT